MSDERNELLKGLSYRDQMHLHIGCIVRNAASLENELMVLITMYVDSATPYKVRPLVQGRRLSELIDNLNQVMPDYPEKPKLIKALRAVNAHRDRLAHSIMSFDIEALRGGLDVTKHWIERQGRTTSTVHGLESSDFPAVERDHHLMVLIINHMMVGMGFRFIEGLAEPESIAEVFAIADSKMGSGWGEDGLERVNEILATGEIVAGFTTIASRLTEPRTLEPSP